MKFERALRDLFQEDASLLVVPPEHKHATVARARNKRRLVGVTGVFLLVTVVVSAMAVSSWVSRDEAGGSVVGTRPDGGVSGPSDEPSVDGAALPTHTCETRLVGEGGVSGDGKGRIPGDWRQQSLMVGPLGLFRADTFSRLPQSRFEALGDDASRYDGLAFYAIVPAGQSVVLSVDPDDHENVRLLLDPAAGDGPPYKFQDGERAIMLEACEESDTEFLEAFLVKGSRCAEIVVESMNGRRDRAQASFGSGSCP